MSFALSVKEEICRERIEKGALALAECFGILLYCHTFAPDGIRIITANADFCRRLPKLWKKAFNLSFDVLPPEDAEGKRTFRVTDPEKLAQIFDAFGYDAQTSFACHVNYALLEEEDTRAAFLRGAFLAGGSVTDPEKRYHLELATAHQSVARETYSILLDLGFSPRQSSRGGCALLYFKQSDAISDLLTVIGAPVTAMNVMTAKVEKEMRNTVTRQINCDSANADKTVTAAQEQLAAIRRFSAASGGLDALPEPLKEAALLRITNPAASLADLARLSYPPLSKSCLSHRLKKIMALAPPGEGESGEEDPAL